MLVPLVRLNTHPLKPTRYFVCLQLLLLNLNTDQKKSCQILDSFTSIDVYLSWVWPCTLVIPTRETGQEGLEFRTVLGYLAAPRPSWAATKSHHFEASLIVPCWRSLLGFLTEAFGNLAPALGFPHSTVLFSSTLQSSRVDRLTVALMKERTNLRNAGCQNSLGFKSSASIFICWVDALTAASQAPALRHFTHNLVKHINEA